MNRRSTLLLTAGLAAGLAVGATQVANAGHTNSVLEADLNGRAEVSDDARGNRIVGDPNGRGEAYVFGIDGDDTTLCYVLTADKIADLDSPFDGTVMNAHIHEGAPDENGPVVAALAFPLGGQAADCLTEGEPGKFPTGEAGIVQEILEHPEDYYINVHNSEYPAADGKGAIRGQLQPLG